MLNTKKVIKSIANDGKTFSLKYIWQISNGENSDNHFLSKLDRLRDHILKLPGFIKTAVTLLSTLLATVAKDLPASVGKVYMLRSI